MIDFIKDPESSLTYSLEPDWVLLSSGVLRVYAKVCRAEEGEEMTSCETGQQKPESLVPKLQAIVEVVVVVVLGWCGNPSGI